MGPEKGIDEEKYIESHGNVHFVKMNITAEENSQNIIGSTEVIFHCFIFYQMKLINYLGTLWISVFHMIVFKDSSATWRNDVACN